MQAFWHKVVLGGLRASFVSQSGIGTCLMKALRSKEYSYLLFARFVLQNMIGPCCLQSLQCKLKLERAFSASFVVQCITGTRFLQALYFKVILGLAI